MTTHAGKSGPSRKEREFRRSWRVTFTSLALGALALGVLLISIAPREKQVVTVYMQAGCESCRRWTEHLAANGFRIEVGRETDWPAIRARFAFPPKFQSSHTAIVDGLFIEGPVPASDIHRALTVHASAHIKGLIVPGEPRGSPGRNQHFRGRTPSSRSEKTGAFSSLQSMNTITDCRRESVFPLGLRLDGKKITRRSRIN